MNNTTTISVMSKVTIKNDPVLNYITVNKNQEITCNDSLLVYLSADKKSIYVILVYFCCVRFPLQHTVKSTQDLHGC